MKRTHTNGELRLENIGEKVTLIGWIAKKRNFGSIIFLDLRDRYGITQLVFNEEEHPEVRNLKNEYLIEVEGTVRERQDSNPNLKTGDIEIEGDKITLINKSKQTPLLIQDETDALEETRLKYRYLDLRRPVMQRRLIERAQITTAIREYLDNNEFIEIETPMLTKSTPEGAREYLVPSRVHAGEFYALAQSPQIFKQLLMISGFERYYQIARCFRDEDLRADRQLDFTQVDIETSFLNETEFMTMMEKLVQHVMKKVYNIDLEVPFERIPFDKALNLYGSDKPDTRFEWHLQDVKEVFVDSEFKVFSDIYKLRDGSIKLLRVPDGASSTRKEIDAMTDLVKKHGAKGLVTFKVEQGNLTGSAVKFLSEKEQVDLLETVGAKDGDLLCIVAGPWEDSCNALGHLRLFFRDKYKLVSKSDFKYAWVNEFPMFEMDEEDNLVARHHPFTRPAIEDINELEGDPLELKAVAYDLVLNGFEIAGGSMRIYDGEIQSKLFEMIGFEKEEIREKFGFFIDAFDYGTPPHGGMAFGLDRFAMVLTQSDTIRDVIAFPKNASARDPLTNAPSPVSDKVLEELHLEIKHKK